jgi:flavin-dependent dehydrogenase
LTSTGDSFDALIAGGGPAGAAAALLLARRGHRVLLAESSRYDVPRAGETLPPYAAKLLTDLGIQDRLELAVPSSAICSAWGSSEIVTQHFLGDPNGPGWHVDRQRFDAMLAEAAAEAGATVLRGTKVAGVARADGGFEATLRAAEGLRTLRARTVIDATGRGSRIARALGARRVVYDRLIGIAAVLAPQGPPAIGDALVLEAAEEGWWYSVPLPDGSLLVAYMTDGDLLSRSRCRPAVLWATAVERTLHTRTRARRFGRIENVRVHNAGTSRLDCAAGAGWLAIGDAASARDPLSADGVCVALASGMNAADALAAYLGGDALALSAHGAAMAGPFDDYLAERGRYYGLEQRWPASLFWCRRHAPGLRATPLLLDPQVPLVAVTGVSIGASASAESLLSPAAVAWLTRACCEPMPAHRLLSELKAALPLPASDRALVVALQLLVDRGALRAGP